MADWIKVRCTPDRESVLSGRGLLWDRRGEASFIYVAPQDAEEVKQLLGITEEEVKKAEKEEKKVIPPEKRVIIPKKEGIYETFEWLQALGYVMFEVKVPHIDEEECEIEVPKKIDTEKYKIFVYAHPKVTGVEFDTHHYNSIKVFGTELGLNGGIGDSIKIVSGEKKLVEQGWSIMKDDNDILLAIWKPNILFFMQDISHEKPIADEMDDRTNLCKFIVIQWMIDSTKFEESIKDLKVWQEKLKKRLSNDSTIPEEVIKALTTRYTGDKATLARQITEATKHISDYEKAMFESYATLISSQERLAMLDKLTVDAKGIFHDEMAKLATHPQLTRIKFDKTGETLALITKPIQYKNLWFGQYLIKIPLANHAGSKKIEIKNLYPEPTHRRHHPHIEENGNICWGNATKSTVELCMTMHLFELTEMVLMFLGTCVETDGWGKTVAYWKEQKTIDYYEKMFGKPPKKEK